MLIRIADNMAVDPETVDAVRTSEIDDVTLVWFNGRDFPWRANADYVTVMSRLERKAPAFGEGIYNFVLDKLGILN